MASSSGPKIAAPQIYGSDPVEQGFAKHVLDPDMGGLAYAFMSSARSHRADAQKSYLDALRESNMLSARLAAHESDQELLGKMITSQAEMTNAGIDPNTIPLNQRLYGTNYGTPTIAIPSGLARDLRKSQIYKNYAEGANAGSGGAPTVTTVYDTGPSGQTGDSRTTVKARDVETAIRLAEEAKRRQKAALDAGNPGAGAGSVIDPKTGAVVQPTTNQARSAANAQAQRDAEARALRERLDRNDMRYRSGT